MPRKPAHRRAWLVVTTAAAILAAAPGVAAANVTDNWESAPALDVNQRGFFHGGVDGVEADEPFTVDGPGSCPDSKPFGAWMGRTVWGTVTGTGGRVVVSTTGSSENTMATVYDTRGADPTFDNWLFCGDDIDNPDRDGRQIPLENTVPGRKYLVQVGSCDGYWDAATQTAADVVDCGPPPNPQYGITVLTNDQRAHPDTGTGLRANIGATREVEPHSCNGTDYGSTVWFRYHATDTGWVTAHAGGNLLTVMAIYRAGGAQPLSCSDHVGSSQLAAEVTQYVHPGENYDIQVGGRAFGGSYDQDQFTYTTGFQKDFDVDRDGSPVPSDCNDRNPAIHPGATDIPYDGVDQDCLRGDLRDFDNDGHDWRGVGGDDCDDHNIAVNPDRTEIPNNGVDDDCANGDAPADLDPEPQLSLPSNPNPHGRIFGDLVLRRLAKGYRVEVRCKGSRACPHRIRRTARHKTLRLHQYFGKVLRPGSRVEVFVTRSGNVRGFYARVTVRKPSRNPARRFCHVRAGTRHTVEACG